MTITTDYVICAALGLILGVELSRWRHARRKSKAAEQTQEMARAMFARIEADRARYMATLEARGRVVQESKP